MEYRRSHVLPAGQEEITPMVASESSPSTTPVSISTPTITYTSSSTVIPISSLLNPPTSSSPSTPLTLLTPSKAPPVSLGSYLTTSFTPINAPFRLDPSSSSLAAPRLLVEDEEDNGEEGDTPHTPTKLLAYLHRRKPHRASRSASSMLTHPSRKVYLPTSAKACKLCRNRGMECVTLPDRKPCAYCTLRSDAGPCSTMEERRSGRGQWWRGVSQAERAAKRKALDGMEREEEDELEMEDGENQGDTEPIPTQLLTYFRTRKPSDKLRQAKSMLSHLNRRVHLSTSPKACSQCREKGVECVTLPTRARCAYCTLRGAHGWYACSTRHERETEQGKGSGEKEIKRIREESTRVELEAGEEDAMEVDVEEDEEEEDKENEGGGETPPTLPSASTPTAGFTPTSATSPLSFSSLSLAAPRLLAHLQSLGSVPRAQCAEAMLTHPSRKVHLPTSPRACTQCQKKGFECVTLPFRMHCAYCASRWNRNPDPCSTRKERPDGKGKARGQMERLRKERVDDKAEVADEIPNLLAYFRSRKTDRNVRSAEPMLTDSRREIQLPTSAKACNNCRQHGMECLTLPDRKLCAFCVLRPRAPADRASCRTQYKRGTEADKERAGDEMEVDEGEDEDEDEVEVEEADELEVDEVEEADRMEVDTELEEVESGIFWSAAVLKLTKAKRQH